MQDGMDQEALAAFLGRGEAYGLPDAAVERIQTHAALIFLVGPRAYKMKRAVRYSFLDFSTLARRQAALEAELRLNRRTAPRLYRRVLPVTATPEGRLELDGKGPPVEWLLEMERFAQEARLDNVAARDGLGEALIEQLAEEIARFHDQAEVRCDCGGFAGLAAVIAGNAGDLRSLAPDVLDAAEALALDRHSEAELARRRDLLEERRRLGFVRHCHGDLHLGNIVLLEDGPILFDCLEFDEALACIDTMYDLAFLLMDLWQRGLRCQAQLLLESYLERRRDDAGLVLLPLFMSCRAAIRAKTNGFAAQLERGEEARKPLRQSARTYQGLALRLLDPRPPCLVAVGGLSGSGKSMLARSLAPELGAAPGAIVLRSDVIRKRIFGVQPTERLPQDAYAEAVSARVYADLADRAAALLRAGQSVVADAVFASPEHRTMIEDMALQARVPFAGLWLEAPADVLENRIARRHGDASDATAAVLRAQLKLDLGTLRWRRIDAAGGPQQVIERARAALAESGSELRP